MRERRKQRTKDGIKKAFCEDENGDQHQLTTTLSLGVETAFENAVTSGLDVSGGKGVRKRGVGQGVNLRVIFQV